MKILALNLFYAPDNTASALMLGDLATGLALRGHEVTVISSRSRYLGGEPLGPGDVLDGVRVVRPWSTKLGKGSIANRMLDYGSFLASASATMATVERPEVVVSMTSPPMIHSLATEIFGARGVPCVLWMQDIYPEISAALGVLSRATPQFRALEAMHLRACARARAVVAISHGMKARLLEQGVSEERIHVVPNWADGELVKPDPPRARAFRAEHGLTDRFVVMYSGNLGIAHDVETAIAAATLLASELPEAVFVFVGGGVGHERVHRAARELPNVRVLPYVPREELAGSLSAADLHLVTLRDGLEGLVVPSKVYGAFAVGRPVLYVGPERCDIAATIRRYDLGWEVRPGDSRAFVDAVIQASRSPALGAARGARALELFWRELDRGCALTRFDDLLRGAGS